MSPIILASTSIYRKQLLQKLGLNFTCEKPEFDEDAAKIRALEELKNPTEMAETLSRGKAAAVLQHKVGEHVVVIAGDQLIDFNGEIIGKSKDVDTAFQQLKKMNNQTHELITAVTVSTSTETRHLNHVTHLTMKNLNDHEILNYLKLDQPFDCAGSYKIEESGIALFSKIDCSDFTAIQGLPLLWVSHQLKELGYELFKK